MDFSMWGFINWCLWQFLYSIFLFNSTPINPASLGVLGNFSNVSLILSEVIGIFICLSFIADHLDFGNKKIFWKIILDAIREFSSSVKTKPSSSKSWSVSFSLRLFITDVDGSFPFLKFPNKFCKWTGSFLFLYCLLDQSLFFAKSSYLLCNLSEISLAQC